MAIKVRLFEIDKDRLDEEWVAHVNHVENWAVEGAKAKKELAEAKSALEVTKAELYRKVQSNPETYGLDESPTIKSIDAVVSQKLKKHADTKRLAEAEHRVDLVQAYNRTLDHRKSALQDLVRLVLADYFSAPETGGGDDMRQAARNMKERRVAKRVKRKKKADDDD